MEDTDLRIHDLVVHKVDHKGHNAPQLAGRRTPTNLEVESFLSRHIKNNRANKNTRTARFTFPERSSVEKASIQLGEIEEARRLVPDEQWEVDVVLRELCYELLRGDEQFLPYSRQIACHLFDVVDKRVSPSELVICTYSHAGSDGAQAERHLALLKMDPEEGFTAREEIEDGVVAYVLEQVPDILPITDLQKCAFVLPEENNEEHDLQVLDQQISTYREGKAIASFFTEGFLQCEVNYNAADRTKIYHMRSLNYASRKEEQDEWSRSQSELFRDRINDSLRDREEVDLVQLADRTIEDESDRQEYLQEMEEDGIGTVFETDQDVAQRATRQRVFVGDHNLKLRIDADAYQDRVEVVPDEVTGENIVKIRTDRWQETS